MAKDLFFELIRVSLGNQDRLSRQPSAYEWGKLYKMAEEQTLLGVCFVGLHNLGADSYDGYARIGIPEDVYFQWMGMAAKIQKRNEDVNRQCVELQVRLAADGIRSCILKGQGVGALYGEISLLRQSGDIDIWMDVKRDDVIAYVKEVCPDDDVDISSKHIEFKLFHDTVVEAHFVPVGMKTPIIGKRIKAYYDSEKGKQMEHKVMLPSGEIIVAPDIAFQSIHILQHAFGHFLFEGIGMRQLMDYYFVIKQPLTEEDKARVVKTMKRFGMYNFARGVAYILTEVFGAHDYFVPKDERWGKLVLMSVMEEGNFGKYDKKRSSKKVDSSWYRFWYHNVRMWKFFDMSPWVIAMSPFTRIYEYFWRFSHGYFKNRRKQ